MRNKTRIAVCAVIVAAGLNTTIANAQTAMQPPLPPVPNSTVKQTEQHFNGNYTNMKRRSLQGGQVQEAWDDADDFEGIFNYEKCDDCTFKVRLREQMISVIKLPAGEKITAVDIGDPDNFKAKIRNTNLLAIKPIGFGGDTNMIVYGENNRIYPFYLRAEGINSKHVPDLVVNIHGEIPTEIEIPNTEERTAPKPIKPMDIDMAKAVSDLAPDGYLKADKDDFVQHVPFDPDKLYGWGEYKLWGDDELRPMTVFRDDHFTYIKFGEKWAGIELPTAYTVIDKIDELVNTHVRGSTFVIESTANLISLKSGKKFLCIQFEGDAR
jgi:ComB9 competence protein